FVLAWPLVMALARLNPQSRTIAVTHASKGALAEAALRVESGDIEQGWHGMFTADGRPEGAAAKLFEGSHSVYTFVPVDRVQKDVEPRVMALRTKPPADFNGHAT